ncbi:fungal-specific transcription factor domain-containing protein [Xylaria cf. heliscus]|nr:fungal-specific transcription factor domain-containing protein [Xylaria cf. heliscus]
MDGGVREKQMADELKVMVKQKANERRERKWGQLPTMIDLSPSTQTQQQQQQEQEQQQEQRRDHQSADHPMHDAGGPVPSDDGSGDVNPSSTVTSETSSSQMGTSNTSSPPSPPSQHSVRGGPIRSAVDAFPENKSEIEVSYTMIYLDYVVPFLFPFYRPCLLESSRGWMLVLLMKNRALFHTALSLANWLYAVLLDSLDGAHGECKRANLAELQAHQEIAIQALQADIKALNERGVANAFRECVSCMQSVIQLLEFEVATASTANWQVHHDAAVVLFDQVMTHHVTTTIGTSTTTTTTATTTDGDAPKGAWSSILERIGFPFRRIQLGTGKLILTSDQSAYQFYTAYLLWIDIMAATATGQVPRLRKYHTELLGDGGGGSDGDGDSDSDSDRRRRRRRRPNICLDDYIGCHSWAMLEIASVAQLAAWKREQQSAGTLSMVHLVRKACAIEARLRARMETLSFSLGDRASDIYDPSAHHPVTPYSGFHEMVGGDTAAAAAHQQHSPAADLHTRIWAQATVTYLHVVASGLQPTLPEIRASVEATIGLLRALPSPLAVRTLVWPFAVTGCLALPGQEAFFVELVGALGAMQVFGTVREALNIMQAVWQHKGNLCIDPQMWDLATCFSVLGHCSLLV